ncbi:hypothetical protein NON00_16450 [Roseomonas sp. GC11]|nr:hypothetical protein [Roseomonas sp. GC11]MCQ4161511.1 hypothetical protein [Roseomonas sp. GC11]
MPQLPTYTSRAPLDGGVRPAQVNPGVAGVGADALAQGFEQVGRSGR